MPTRQGIVCAGISCLDLFLHGTEPLLTRESLSHVQRVEYRPGGATSNTGRALARLGMPVEVMTVIGVDVNGDLLRHLWEDDGIHCQYVVRTPAASTALSVIPVYADGKRGVYICSGTNAILDQSNLFGPRQEYLPILRERAAFHYGYPPLSPRLQYTALAEMLATVRETGVLVSLDTTPVADDTSLKQLLGEALPLVHLFAPNIEEAAQVTGHFSRLAARAAHAGLLQDFEDIVTPDDLQQIGQALLAYGIPLVVITLGKQGAFICTGDTRRLTTVPRLPDAGHAWANIRGIVPAYTTVGPLNTTGAGDTFAAGLLTGITQGHEASFVEIVRFAQAASALHIDTSRGLRTAAAVQDAQACLPVRPLTNPYLQELT